MWRAVGLASLLPRHHLGCAGVVGWLVAVEVPLTGDVWV